MNSRLISKKENLVFQLRAYGENELATQVDGLTARQWTRIGEIAFKFALRSDTPGGQAMLLDKALCLAAVVVLEGEERELKRKRRYFPRKRSKAQTILKKFWQKLPGLKK